jgi:hypothetical protein
MALLSAHESLETQTAVKKTVALYQSSTIYVQSGQIMWKAMIFNLPTANGSLNLTHCGPVFFPLYLSQIINSK